MLRSRHRNQVGPAENPTFPQRPWDMKALIVGFVCTVVLGLITMGTSTVELARVQKESAQLADDGLRTSYQLGNVGEQIARLRAQVVLLRETPSFERGEVDLVARTESRLQEAIDGLGTGLDPVSRQRWSALLPQVLALRNSYMDAASLTRSGQSARATELLRRSVTSAASLHDALDDLEQVHAEQMLGTLAAQRVRTSRVQSLAMLSGVAFFAGLFAIWIVVFRKLRRKRRQLAEYTARLESANSDLDAFAGRVAHDLKNALGPIVMAPDLLRFSSTNPGRVLDVAARTERCSRRAVAIVDSLLAFARAQTLDLEPGSVRAAVNNVVDDLRPHASQAGTSIEVDPIPDLYVRCSAGLLNIVLANLCSNAVKYLEGRPEKRVHIRVRSDDSFCRIEVEDTGRGIPREAQQKIFEPFYRVPGSREPGSGIGLATVRRILDAQGGRITVESTEGQGSRFVVWLPLSPPPSADEHVAPHPHSIH
jgi:signal transduction histidine kinase